MLQSNDWKKWRPAVVVVEDFEFFFRDPTKSAIYQLMIASGYQMMARLLYSSVFVSEESDIKLYQRD